MTVFTGSVAFPAKTAPNSNSLAHNRVRWLLPNLSNLHISRNYMNFKEPGDETRRCVGMV